MGLDIVEFQMGVEEAFGVVIPDDVVERIATPRQLTEWLCLELPPAGAWCRSQRVFYHVRRAVAAHTGRSRADLRPGSSVRDLLPPDNASRSWAAIGRAVGLPRWPRLNGGGMWDRMFPPTEPRTLGDAVRAVVGSAPPRLKPSGQGWARNEVAAVIERLVRYHFVIRDYNPDDRFIDLC